MTKISGYVSIMITRRCNMTCAHCSVASGPQIKGEPAADDLVRWIRDAVAAGARSIRLTGGEPMLREAVVLRLLRECRALGVVGGMTTNGFWGRTPADATRRVSRLVRAGLAAMTISVDRFHAEFQAGRSVRHIAEAADRAGLPTNINMVRGADDGELGALAAPFDGLKHIRLRFYDIQAVGRARDLPASTFKPDAGGFCSACESPAIADDGRVMACIGPAYFEAPTSPLIVGRIGDTPLATLIERHASDPILDTIRTSGPARLRDELRQTPGFESFAFRDRYSGMCDLCRHVTSDPAAVAALRVRLAAPQQAAERMARRRVIDAARVDGALSWAYVNGAGFARAMVQLAATPDHEPTAETERVLTRADLDWRQRARYLIGCGMARVVSDAIDASVVRRWAPAFFTDLIHGAAVQEGIRALVQRDALRQVDEGLVSIGAEGVLLKGAALRPLGESRPAGIAARASGDLDVYVEPAAGVPLRHWLLERGWRGAPDARRTAAHHLAPISFSGVPLEIHGRIMPAAWGLPEQDLLARRRAWPSSRALATLDPAGFLVHAVVHSSAHMFSGGLKTGWDVRWIASRYPDVAWESVRRLADAVRMPRAFWVPMRALDRALDLGAATATLGTAPSDRRERDLEFIAGRLLFSDVERVCDLNPVSRNALALLLHDSWSGRARHLAGLFSPDARDARAEAALGGGAQRWRHVPGHLKTAWQDWERYRRARHRAGIDTSSGVFGPD